MLKTEELLGKRIADQNALNLDRLKNLTSAGKVTWILGAGISKSAGVPLWSECLLRMWARILYLEKEDNLKAGKEFRDTLNDMKSQIKKPEKVLRKINLTISGKMTSEILNGVNTLEAAEYIQNFVAESVSRFSNKDELYEQAFVRLLRDALKPELSPKEILDKLKNQVIGLLASYFTRQVNENKKVTVISYNFDNLLEFALENEGLEKRYCYIKNPGTTEVFNGKKGVHIYHPHGTVSVVPTALSEDSGRFVLAESNYGRLEQKAYIWENSIQAKALHESSCVFLGFSGEDYNFRRIIKNMESDEERQDTVHYLFLSLESLVKKMFGSAVNKKLLGDVPRTEEERERLLGHISKTEYDAVLRQLLKNEEMIYERMLIIKKLYAQYLYWERHNIIPIWTTRDELPEMVGRIIT